MRTFVVTAEHTPRGVWVLEAPEVGAVSQVRRLAHAADEMREAVAHLAGLPETEVDIQVTTILPDEFTAALEEARKLRDIAVTIQAQAATANRHAARALTAEGFTVRDIGDLMDVSPQRVSQLVSNSTAAARTRR